jgi:hypothetical protein
MAEGVALRRQQQHHQHARTVSTISHVTNERSNVNVL